MDDDDETIDFYNHIYEEPTLLGQGTLTWVTILKKDVYSRALLLSSNKDEEKVLFTNVKNSQRDGNLFANKFLSEEIASGISASTLINPKVSRKNKPLFTAIENVVKDSKLVWILVDKYFDSELYCCMPILDKTEFIDQLSGIIGPRNNSPGKSITINITRKIQLAIIGILLIVMRMSSLTLYNAGKPLEQPLSSSDQFISDHPVGKEAISTAVDCLSEVLTFKETHVTILQFNLMMQHYKFIGPEDCDCVVASSITNTGPLIHAAVGSGLNRDPTLSHPNYDKPDLLRRLWYLVVYLDYYQMMLVGYGPVVNYDFHDTDLPILNHHESALQYGINEAFHDRKRIFESCRPLLTSVLSVKRPPKIKTVLNHLKKLEELVETSVKIEEIMRIPSDSVLDRFRKMRLFQSTSDQNALLFMIYYNFFLHHNEKKDSEKSLYYLLQMLKISKNVYPYLNFFGKPDKSNEAFNLNKHFGVGALAIPKMELCLHRVSELMISLLGRIKTHKSIVGVNMDEERLILLDKIGKVVFRITFFIIEALVNISDTYYHCWSMSKIQSFITEKILRNKDGLYDSGSLDKIESEYVKVVEDLRGQDDGFFLYTNQDLQQILNAIELIDISALGHSPSPESLFYDLNSYRSKNDQVWFDQLMFDSNFNFDNNSVTSNQGNNTITPTSSNSNNNTPFSSSFAGVQFMPEFETFGSNIFDFEQLLHQSVKEH